MMVPFFSQAELVTFGRANADGPFCYLMVVSLNKGPLMLHTMQINVSERGTMSIDTLKLARYPRSLMRQHLACLDDDRPLKERP